MDNLSQQLLERLDDYLDHKLSEAEMQSVAELLEQDPEARRALEQIRTARTLINLNGLQQRVRSGHVENMKHVSASDTNWNNGLPGVVRYLRPALRMAAAVAVIILAAGVFQFFTLDGLSVYEDNYLGYHLSVTRNDDVKDHREIDSLYRAGQFEAVILSYNSGDSSDNFSRFLTAMAYLEKGREQEAIPLFLSIQQKNKDAAIKSFEQESEYYLSLAYLKSGETRKALDIIKSIKSNERHVFRNNFSDWEVWKLKMIALKD